MRTLSPTMRPASAVEIAGRDFTQKPQRYAAKAFGELRRKRAAANDDALAALLGETGCDAFLAGQRDAQEEVASDAEEDEGGDGEE